MNLDRPFLNSPYFLGSSEPIEEIQIFFKILRLNPTETEPYITKMYLNNHFLTLHQSEQFPVLL